MFAYVIRRLLQLPIVLLAVSLIIILMMQPLSPEQRAANYLSEQQAAREEIVQNTIEKYGFDKPFYVQYWRWLSQAARGDLGYSQQSKQPVLRTIIERFPASAELAIYAVIPIIILSVWLGTMAALNRGKFIDQITRVLSIIGWSLPTFVFAIWLLVLFYREFTVMGLVVLATLIPLILLALWLRNITTVAENVHVRSISHGFSVLSWIMAGFVLLLWLATRFYPDFFVAYRNIDLSILLETFNPFGLGRVSNEFLLEINRGNITTPTRFYTIDSIINGRFDMLRDFWLRLVLPVTTLFVVISAQLIRVMRSSLLDALSQDYVRTAKAKGLSERSVNLKHARRNALIPVITLSGLMVAGLLNGTVFTEVIFNYRGLGLWFASSAVALDIPAVTGFALLVSVIIVLANLGVDLLYGLIDPRIRYD